MQILLMYVGSKQKEYQWSHCDLTFNITYVTDSIYKYILCLHTTHFMNHTEDNIMEGNVYGIYNFSSKKVSTK